MPRRESVPFAFTAGVEPSRPTDFRSDVAPPPRPPLSLGRLLGRVLVGAVVVGGLVGAVALAGPALDVEQHPSPEAPEAAVSP